MLAVGIVLLLLPLMFEGDARNLWEVPVGADALVIVAVLEVSIASRACPPTPTNSCSEPARYSGRERLTKRQGPQSPNPESADATGIRSKSDALHLRPSRSIHQSSHVNRRYMLHLQIKKLADSPATSPTRSGRMLKSSPSKGAQESQGYSG